MPQFRTTLKKGLPIFYIGILSITLVDSVCSIISRVYDIQYSSFYPLSYTIYILIPFFISLKTNKRTAVIYAALLGAFDATIGWTISMLLERVGELKNTGSLVTFVVAKLQSHDQTVY